MNPFRDTVMADPWTSPRDDVPTIHQQVFAACLDGLEHVRTMQRSAALLIQGAAGSGKTHLFSRLRSQLAPTLPTATDRQEALFVWVRLHCTPRMIWRHVRRTLVNDWFRPLRDARNQFDRILFHRLAELRVAEGDLEPWYEYMLEDHPADLRDLIDQVATNLDLDRNTRVALQHLTFNRHRSDLQAWLCGDRLPEVALNRLELELPEDGEQEAEDQAKRVTLMLCRLAGNQLPVVIGFDQVEALESGPEDREALFKFGQLVSELHDSARNVLIISAVQSSFAIRLMRESREADRDRMTSLGQLNLAPLDRDQARELIRRRVLAAGERLPPSARHDPFWPLSEHDFAELLSLGAVTPRKLLTLCAERFDKPVDSSAPTSPIQPQPESALPDFLAETWETVLQDKLKTNQPQLTEDILRHALPMAAKMLRPGLETVVDQQLPDMTPILEGPSGRTGVSVCAFPNMNSLTSRLKRLTAQFALGRVNRLVIVRDTRVPLTETAKKARELLDELQGRGAAVVHASSDVLAALDALRALLADARSGDLAYQGESVLPTTLEDWFAKHLAHPLREFVEAIIEPSNSAQPSDPDSDLIEAVNTLLTNQPLLSLEDAARQLHLSSAALEQLAERHPQFVGVLGNSDPLLFRVVQAASVPTDARA